MEALMDLDKLIVPRAGAVARFARETAGATIGRIDADDSAARYSPDRKTSWIHRTGRVKWRSDSSSR
ncbi:MAG: hypothetical protein ABFS86_10605, partial [Planctomycetota bacterium]